MKWMGGWSWSQYLSAPAELVEEAERLMFAEAEALEEIRKGHGRNRSPFHVERDARGRPAIVKDEPAKEPERIAAVEIDPRTGRQIVTKVKEDGTVVKHRKIEEGELIIHRLFGKPKSFQNK